MYQSFMFFLLLKKMYIKGDGIETMRGNEKTQKNEKKNCEFERVQSTANAVTLQMIDFINKINS